MMKFDEIFERLGGVDTSIKYKNDSEVYDNEKVDLIQLEKFDVNHNFMQFILEHPPFQFKENVAIKNTNKELLNLMKEELLHVNIFYSMNKNSKYSISKELDLLNDQIPKNLFPFCSDGYSGDFFCIGIEKENYGEIFYFWHEGHHERFFKICDSFDIFLKSLINFNIPVDDFYDEEDNTPPSGDFKSTLLKWKEKHGLN
ncbi:SMI1/KNR4 family protein [Tamlana sp. 2201CG12-4]|uniref:SMI1/KNR4 family protein n=1 Tax=Tamlana sp. 2201CG12-4 TaxID=3112582 RepID=UPI002DBB67D3|nr:SMI1/KNR4 family protein [Tamlana sp. 2201CG12-4]MEC3906117.1 SMI1/KNR4 family protein [Tamlana sp. 2201CG12-4]